MFATLLLAHDSTLDAPRYHQKCIECKTVTVSSEVPDGQQLPNGTYIHFCNKCGRERYNSLFNAAGKRSFTEYVEILEKQ